MAGLLHTLSLVVAPVTWIVVEAGGVTNETSSLLQNAQVERLVHLGWNEGMPHHPEDQAKVETRMRIEGLRCVMCEGIGIDCLCNFTLSFHEKHGLLSQASSM